MKKNPLIEISNLTKIYPRSKEPAVDNLCLNIYEGEIFGLLGPNGAGKTTTLSVLCNLIAPTKGYCNINGYCVLNEFDRIKPLIGVVSQDIALYPTLTAYENLRYFGSMFDLPKNELKERIFTLLEKMGLLKYKDEKIKHFSGGMKRRVNLLAGILHMPKIVILDEPTVGIDVQSRIVILDYLEMLNHNGMTLLYSSHMLDEAEKFCSRIAIIDNGKIISKGTSQELIMQGDGFKNLEDVFLYLTGRNVRD